MIRLILVVAVALVLAGCTSQAPLPDRPDEPEGTKSPAYALTIRQLTDLNVKAAELVRQGDRTQAAALVKDGQPLARQLLRARKPTLEAMEAVSDLDHIYGTLLLENGHYIWARQFFQTNVARWKNWAPRTDETARRLAQAEKAVARCDELMKRQTVQRD